MARMLGDLTVGPFAEVAMHVPVEGIHRASTIASEAGADCAVAIGGGSAIRLVKAITLATSLPIVAVPTTYVGGMMTPIPGRSKDLRFGFYLLRHTTDNAQTEVGRS
ncbi:hypothetical protein R75465_08257 [Paraburkholderia aspalathi]|nr:hypothetical protein R75465_08257 [Paraburkholderia aspalathi]